MIDLDQELESENLSQKDIMKYLLHSTQHSATREELQATKVELKQEIADVKKELKQEIADVKKELKQDIADVRVELQDVKKELKQDIADVKNNIDKLDLKIDKVSLKFDRMQWLIVATIVSIFMKDYILEFLGK